MPRTPDSNSTTSPTSNDTSPSRRSWLQRSAGIAAATALGYPLVQYASGCSKHEQSQDNNDDGPKKLVVCKESELGPNQTKLVHHRGQPIVVYRVGDGPPVARSAKCTHMGCTVRYRPAKKDLNCACHNAIYDPKTGSVVSGPATKPLKAYPVHVVDGSIVIDV